MFRKAKTVVNITIGVLLLGLGLAAPVGAEGYSPWQVAQLLWRAEQAGSNAAKYHLTLQAAQASYAGASAEAARGAALARRGEKARAAAAHAESLRLSEQAGELMRLADQYRSATYRGGLGALRLW